MNETHRHCLLLAKHWYERPEGYPDNGIAAYQEARLEDLQYILSIIYEWEYSRFDCWHILTEMFVKYLEPHIQIQYLNKMFDNNAVFSEFTDSADYAKAVSDMLSMFSCTAVEGNPKMDGLGEPDYEMFPKLAKKAE